SPAKESSAAPSRKRKLRFRTPKRSLLHLALRQQRLQLLDRLGVPRLLREVDELTGVIVVVAQLDSALPVVPLGVVRAIRPHAPRAVRPRQTPCPGRSLSLE